MWRCPSSTLIMANLNQSLKSSPRFPPVIPATVNRHPCPSHDMCTSAAHDETSTWNLRKSTSISPMGSIRTKPKTRRKRRQRYEPATEETFLTRRRRYQNAAAHIVEGNSASCVPGTIRASPSVRDLYIYLAISQGIGPWLQRINLESGFSPMEACCNQQTKRAS